MKVGRAILVLAAAIAAGAAAAATPKLLRLGDMQISYDGARWRADASGEGVLTMHPVGAIATKFDPVRVTRAPGDQSCEKLGRDALPKTLYEDTAGIHIDVAGMKALRMSAHTRCRNAMPQGVVICMMSGGSAYLLTASRDGCRSGGNNLFSGIDPLNELMGGLRFTP
jgi:hypothetical protein